MLAVGNYSLASVPSHSVLERAGRETIDCTVGFAKRSQSSLWICCYKFTEMMLCSPGCSQSHTPECRGDWCVPHCHGWQITIFDLYYPETARSQGLLEKTERVESLQSDLGRSKPAFRISRQQTCSYRLWAGGPVCQSFLVLKMIYSFAFLKKKKRGVDLLQETGSPGKQFQRC